MSWDVSRKAATAEIAGLTRADFIGALSHHRVNPYQYTAEELIEEMRNAG